MADTGKTERLGFLDGLRGWGAILVFVYHLVYRFLAKDQPWLAPDSIKLLMDGQFAVFVFFVISGYALSHANLDPARRDLQMAATSRYFRLAIPILVTTFIGYLLLKAGLLISADVSRETGVSGDWLGTFYTFPASGYDFVKFSLFNSFFYYYSRESYNSSLWTISYEFLGSMIVYGYLAVFRSHGRGQWIIAVAAFLVCIKVAPIYACFFGGYLAAEARYSIAIRADWKWVVELLALLTFYSIGVVMTFARPGNEDFGALALLATSLVFAVTFSRYLRSFFSNRLSSFLGRVSFPLYLFHIFVICSWSSYLFVWLPTTGLAVPAQMAINIVSTAAICLVCATALLPVEKFSVRYSKKIAALILRRT
ncbi:acyltransferase [Rhizobium sp. BK176]|uniref:acyltransferase family protein n=1 Tax=Rhizobium sp. BK176 TaxID=2587071 RepID=UPI0021692AA4|nr:acyltransferase [Rhizobium sp. BK176]MCS4089991.1 peptidoglycan/LPS O-acetylase OafA/YrhL [Rhizobium sp. BK176]